MGLNGEETQMRTFTIVKRDGTEQKITEAYMSMSTDYVCFGDDEDAVRTGIFTQIISKEDVKLVTSEEVSV